MIDLTLAGCVLGTGKRQWHRLLRVITSAIILIDILIIAERAMDSIWPSLPSRVYVATALIEVGLRMKQVRLPTNYCLLLSKKN